MTSEEIDAKKLLLQIINEDYSNLPTPLKVYNKLLDAFYEILFGEDSNKVASYLVDVIDDAKELCVGLKKEHIFSLLKSTTIRYDDLRLVVCEKIREFLGELIRHDFEIMFREDIKERIESLFSISFFEHLKESYYSEPVHIDFGCEIISDKKDLDVLVDEVIEKTNSYKNKDRLVRDVAITIMNHIQLKKHKERREKRKLPESIIEKVEKFLAKLDYSMIKEFYDIIYHRFTDHFSDKKVLARVLIYAEKYEREAFIEAEEIIKTIRKNGKRFFMDRRIPIGILISALISKLLNHPKDENKLREAYDIAHLIDEILSLKDKLSFVDNYLIPSILLILGIRKVEEVDFHTTMRYKDPGVILTQMLSKEGVLHNILLLRKGREKVMNIAKNLEFERPEISFSLYMILADFLREHGVDKRMLEEVDIAILRTARIALEELNYKLMHAKDVKKADELNKIMAETIAENSEYYDEIYAAIRIPIWEYYLDLIDGVISILFKAGYIGDLAYFLNIVSRYDDMYVRVREKIKDTLPSVVQQLDLMRDAFMIKQLREKYNVHIVERKLNGLKHKLNSLLRRKEIREFCNIDLFRNRKYSGLSSEVYRCLNSYFNILLDFVSSPGAISPQLESFITKMQLRNLDWVLEKLEEGFSICKVLEKYCVVSSWSPPSDLSRLFVLALENGRYEEFDRLWRLIYEMIKNELYDCNGEVITNSCSFMYSLLYSLKESPRNYFSEYLKRFIKYELNKMAKLPPLEVISTIYPLIELVLFLLWWFDPPYCSIEPLLEVIKKNLKEEIIDLILKYKQIKDEEGEDETLKKYWLVDRTFRELCDLIQFKCVKKIVLEEYRSLLLFLFINQDIYMFFDLSSMR